MEPIEHRLRIGRFLEHDNSILEVIIDEGCRVEQSDIREVEDLVRKIGKSPLGILVNKKNDYSYSLNALVQIASSGLTQGIAILYYGKPGLKYGNILGPALFHVKYFRNRKEAEFWLTEEVLKIKE